MCFDPPAYSFCFEFFFVFRLSALFRSHPRSVCVVSPFFSSLVIVFDFLTPAVQSTIISVCSCIVTTR